LLLNAVAIIDMPTNTRIGATTATGISAAIKAIRPNMVAMPYTAPLRML